MKNLIKKSVIAAVLLLSGVAFYSCSDKVDESDYATFTGETITSYLKGSEKYTSFVYICSKVRLSSRSESTIDQLLSARGNYTVFAPTNEAVQHYLDSIYVTKDYDITQIPDSTAEYIVRNAIIDNGSNKAYLTTDFLVGALEKTNMNDRYITVSYSNDSTGHSETVINEHSIITAADIEVENGVIHGVNTVLKLSNAYLPALIEQTDNLKIFSLLLSQTGWDDKMSIYRDENYEQNHEEFISSLDGSGQKKAPEHRYFGFTAFVETDSVFVEKWGLPQPIVENGILQNVGEILEAVKAKCAEIYPDAKGTDLKKEDNAVNQFVSYHLLPERLTWDKIVVHHAEMGYAYNNPTNLSIDCFEFYETLCTSHRRLLAITEGKETDGKRLNRHCEYRTNVEAGEFYEEYNVDRPGILVLESNGGRVNNALNGFYYTIDDVLVYDDDVPNVVLNKRLRWDVSSLLPELITNGYRLIKDNDQHMFPLGYFDNLQVVEGSRVCYFPYYSSNIDNYQGDEFNVRGQYDMILRLPPVPYRGTWEFRLAAPTNTSFGMAQIYIGKNPNNLTPVGLPLDLRLSQNKACGWEQDDLKDWDHNYENDKIMRNHGYMKPPYHDGIKKSGNVITESLRNTTTYANNLRMRKIITQGTFDPDEVWYIRVKSVMENTNLAFLLDYLEFAPKWVYSGSEAEDIW